jgi:arginine decarboxylase
MAQLLPGGITFCVMARNDTNEPNRLVSAAIGLALPKDTDEYGYLSEHHGYGEMLHRYW